MKSTFYIFALILFSFCSCSNAAQLQEDPIPTHQTFTVNSEKVKETRTINVWTPSEYAADTTKRFPVLYMLDGGIKEDFPHVANTLAVLIKNKSIPPTILVGIENTQRRRDLTGATNVEEDKKIAPVVGGSENFRAFLKDELFSEVANKYRVNEEKAIIGESVAGLFVVETLLLYPEMFNAYIAFDPSLWWNNHELVKTTGVHLSKFPLSEIRFWFAGSNAKDIYVHTKKLAEVLKSENTPQLTWNYSNEPKEKHNTIFRATKEKALIWTLGSTK